MSHLILLFAVLTYEKNYTGYVNVTSKSCFTLGMKHAVFDQVDSPRDLLDNV